MNFKHGHAARSGRSKLYETWLSMKQRCGNKRSHMWKHYGKRGITICKRWRDSFDAFAEDMGEPPSKDHSIGRINNAIGYRPSNCEWQTITQQNRNTSRSVYFSAFGERKTLIEWAFDARCAVTYWTLCARIRYGWNPRRALTAKALIKRPRKFSGFNRFTYGDDAKKDLVG